MREVRSTNRPWHRWKRGVAPMPRPAKNPNHPETTCVAANSGNYTDGFGISAGHTRFLPRGVRLRYRGSLFFVVVPSGPMLRGDCTKRGVGLVSSEKNLW